MHAASTRVGEAIAHITDVIDRNSCLDGIQARLRA